MRQRYCGNCGRALGEGQRFCGNCGSPVHATARVPTPEADVPTPPPPQQHQSATEDGRETRGPMLALVAVFLVLGIAATAQEMPSAASGESMGYKIGYGAAPASIYVFFVAVLVLTVSGVDYLLIRGRGRRPGLGGLTFRQVLLSWPYVVVAVVLVLLFVV